MKCIKINNVVDYMLSLDLTDFIEEKILVKEKDYIYTSMIRVTYDRTLIRCVPIQSVRGGRGLYDGRTIYAPIDSTTTQMIYFDCQIGRINSQQTNEANVPQAVVVEDYGSWTTLDLERIDE